MEEEEARRSVSGVSLSPDEGEGWGRERESDGGSISRFLVSGDAEGLVGIRMFAFWRSRGEPPSLFGWRMCERWAERGRGVPELVPTLGLARALLVELDRRWKDGEGTASSELRRTERSVARLEEEGL